MRAEPQAHPASHRSVVGDRGKDDHIQAVDEEVEIEDALDESVPLVLQEAVQRLHQEHVMAILWEAKRGEAHSSQEGPPCRPPSAPGTLHIHSLNDHTLGLSRSRGSQVWTSRLLEWSTL